MTAQSWLEMKGRRLCENATGDWSKCHYSWLAISAVYQPYFHASTHSVCCPLS